MTNVCAPDMGLNDIAALIMEFFAAGWHHEKNVMVVPYMAIIQDSGHQGDG